MIRNALALSEAIAEIFTAYSLHKIDFLKNSLVQFLHRACLSSLSSSEDQNITICDKIMILPHQ